VKREVIREAFRRVEGNVTKAAPLLKMSRDILRYRILKHGIDE
jgi:DNA-binding NtrC family response regulator